MTFSRNNENLKLNSSTSPSVIVENAPLNFVRSGYYQFDGRLLGAGTAGYNWSIIASELTAAYYFAFSSDGFYPQANSPSKGDGLSVRCIT